MSAALASTAAPALPEVAARGVEMRIFVFKSVTPLWKETTNLSLHSKRAIHFGPVVSVAQGVDAIHRSAYHHTASGRPVRELMRGCNTGTITEGRHQHRKDELSSAVREPLFLRPHRVQLQETRPDRQVATQGVRGGEIACDETGVPSSVVTQMPARPSSLATWEVGTCTHKSPEATMGVGVERYLDCDAGQVGS